MTENVEQHFQHSKPSRKTIPIPLVTPIKSLQKNPCVYIKRLYFKKTNLVDKNMWVKILYDVTDALYKKQVLKKKNIVIFWIWYSRNGCKTKGDMFWIKDIPKHNNHTKWVPTENLELTSTEKITLGS
jgi:hypothetical protein